MDIKKNPNLFWISFGSESGVDDAVFCVDVRKVSCVVQTLERIFLVVDSQNVSWQLKSQDDARRVVSDLLLAMGSDYHK